MVDWGDMFKSIHLSHYLSWILFAIFLILYGQATAPSIVELFDDTLEFQLVVPTFGITHPTGYPFYTILGGLWSRFFFPFGNWAWRVNLLSAIFGAATVSTVFLIASRLIKDKFTRAHLWIALPSTILFGLGPVWWSQATIAEIYTLHNLFVGLILYTALQIPRGDLRSTIRDSGFTILFALVGLSLAHHRTTVLLLPGVALYLLSSIPRLWRPNRIWLRWLSLLFAPLLLYLYIPLRASMGAMDLNGSYINTWQGFQTHILAQAYQTFFQENALAVQMGYWDWLTVFQQQLGLVGLGAALIGIGRFLIQWLRWTVHRLSFFNRFAIEQNPQQLKDWSLIFYIFVANLLFTIYYRVPDFENFLLPAFLCASLFAGIGIYLIGQSVYIKISQYRWGNNRYISTYAPLLYASLFIALIFGVGGRGQTINRSQDWAVHDYAVAMAKVNFPPKSRVIGLEGEMSALKYMQQAEGLGQNASAIVADPYEERRIRIEEAVAAGASLYLTREIEGIGHLYSFSGEGPLIRVWPRGESIINSPSHLLDILMMDGMLQLAGYDIEPLAQAGGSALRVAFYWRPLLPLPQRLKLSLRLQQDNGEPFLNQEGKPVQFDRFPLRQVSYSDQWLPNELIRDVHTIDLPTSTASGLRPAKLLAIIYDAETAIEVGRWTFALSPQLMD